MANKSKMWRELSAHNIGNPEKGVPPKLSARQRLHRQRYQIDGVYPSNLLAKLLDNVIGKAIEDEQEARTESLIKRVAKLSGETVENARKWWEQRKVAMLSKHA